MKFLITTFILLMIQLVSSVRADDLDGLGQTVMKAEDLAHLSQAEPGKKIHYGLDRWQFGELYLPDGPGPFPVIAYFHGGCWLAEYGDLTNSRPIAHALTDLGLAVWSVEYRRIGNEGAGWPGTFLDAGAGVDHLFELAEIRSLDLTRVVSMGHSVGGHLALWVAARSKQVIKSELHTDQPLEISGVVGLAPVPELRMMFEEENCGNSVRKLMGGTPVEFPERYLAGTPSSFAPIGVPQHLILGQYDTIWAPNGRTYVREARARGDEKIIVIEAEESGHFEMIDPSTTTWPLVRDAVRAILSL